MSPEFYSDDVVEQSWRRLQALAKTYPFTLIGGWAAWCYAQKERSRDIDIVVDYPQLQSLREEYPNLTKNDRLRKYEIPCGVFDIDVYVPYYSTTLTVPPEYLLSHSKRVQTFAVPEPEALMALKLGAWIDRKDSLHGQKDLLDLRGILPWCSKERLQTLSQRAAIPPRHRETLNLAMRDFLPLIPKKEREAFLHPPRRPRLQ